MVDTLWQRLLQRVGPARPVALTRDPDLHLLVDGRRVEGRGLGHGRSMFRIGPRPNSVRIVSRSAAPDQLGLARDPRHLGIAVRSVAAWRGREVRIVEAADPALVDGWHNYEPECGFRWTDGDAALPEALLDGICEPTDLVITAAMASTYPAAASTG